MSTTNTLKHNGITWTDIQCPSKLDLEKLSEKNGFIHLHSAEYLTGGQLPQADFEKKYLFLLLQYPIEKKQTKLNVGQIGVFMGRDYIITLHDSSATELTRLFKECQTNSEAAKHYIRSSPGHLLYTLTANVLDQLAALIPPMTKELNLLEDRVFDNLGSDAFAIGQQRQRIMKLKRITVGLKPVLEDLALGINDFTGDHLKAYYASNVKTIQRIRDTLDEASETIEIYKDADFTTNTERTNDILAVLTLLFTLTIPATVLGAFYGMNVILPGGIDSDTWHFLGDYTTFKVVIIASAVSAATMYAYFRRKRWF